MRITIKEMKEAFIAESNRASNLSLGRAFFQDFEIAHFINAAYEIVLAKKMAGLDERYVSMDNRQKVSPSNGLPDNLHLLSDLGLLWAGSVIVAASVPGSTKDGTVTDSVNMGKDTRHFLIRRDTANQSPHILNPRVIEYDNTTVAQVKILRPITSLDATKLSLVYQNDQYMPYAYYQIRRFGVVLQSDNRITNMGGSDSAGWTDSSSDYLECSIKSIAVGTSAFALNYDAVISPVPVTAAEITNESPRKLEVTFCYEIVLQATQLAMESLGSERSNTLAQINQQTQQ